MTDGPDLAHHVSRGCGLFAGMMIIALWLGFLIALAARAVMS